ncbi:GIY-YIG endonuclease (mitochondrion) [Rhizoctonia solani 123E]|uniref:GIY-YIG endonuclease family protein n=2 Tax=Rhizoctonia solani TaxID=456999 RepID=N0A341_9AGAM|nr:GIY-YIG endonuclease family protein [Rhizoctonia solani]AGK45361.1 GIY-YIG endonuclease family protein [Rhizoctonia solani]KEP45605.1 GIY-YIG endonuclease [Rhizoctonia solani 123E]
MQTSFFFINLAIELPSLRISSLLAFVLVGIGTFFANVMYIQSIGSDLTSFGDQFNNFLFTNSSIGLEDMSLLLLSLPPIKPSGVLSIDEIKSQAVKVFENPVRDRKEISSFLKGKSGVYLWYLESSGKYYVGSSVDLRYRFYDYFSESYFYKSGSSAIIANAIAKYGLDAFQFLILEFTEKSETLSREQFFIDTLEPEYNILKKAGSTLGFKPTGETKDKLSRAAMGRIHSLETRAKISESQKNNKNNPGLALSVKDLETNITIEYSNFTQAASELGFSRTTISMGFKQNNGTPFVVKGRYEITVKPS